ncbi:DUF3106 domain-containing protein [Variovorax sp. RHLX14]|uniref:DUF3106 domain-containing protein n=1 Tax=Variovorax sp. RHLX14 TaxID=1259731 RepID=UPI003F47C562
MPFQVVKLPLSSLKRGLASAFVVGAVALSMAGIGFVANAAPALQNAPPAKTGSAKPAPSSRPHWRDLTAQQQQTLNPLAASWDDLSESQKRKWIVISRNQGKLSPEESAVQHSRMTEWAGLSRQQREQARFNFDEVKQVPAAERKAKWEVYQALSDDEKRRLADSAAKRPQGAAGTIRPVPAQKLAPVPAARVAGRPGPRIELAPTASAAAAAATSAPAPSVTPVSPLLPARQTQDDSSSPVAPAPVVPLLSN